MDPADLPPLNTYSKDEWFDVCRYLDPTLTRERLDEMWREFVQARERRGMH